MRDTRWHRWAACIDRIDHFDGGAAVVGDNSRSVAANKEAAAAFVSAFAGGWKLFKEHSGVTPGEYRKMLKVRSSCKSNSFLTVIYVRDRQYGK
ncbi:hypothetical protein [Paenibacillus cremeus]|uniref:Uncharacterized protein n=1 Tax=Paenibacillus cremeus TaxID=2163881 RepID=A0A559K942_9BACL|nr:hypothetical protein [Paenibacillus cremeus]TVY08648.1 hypothetical protein FPZ49_17645 [Paenibacillus cremeus]